MAYDSCLQVFLTLSAESNAAKETLPKFSYIKVVNRKNKIKTEISGDRHLVWVRRLVCVRHDAASAGRDSAGELEPREGDSRLPRVLNYDLGLETSSGGTRRHDGRGQVPSIADGEPPESLVRAMAGRKF